MNHDFPVIVSLNAPEVAAVFVRLKQREESLDDVERKLLIKLERALHLALSIDEMDRLNVEAMR